MLLDVSRALREPGTEFPFIHPEEIPPQDVLGDTVTFDSPVVMEGTFAMTEKRLRITGKLRAVVHAHCANCLADVMEKLVVPFDEVFEYVDRYEAAASSDSPEEDKLQFDGYQVDLSQIALTLAVLELPIRFLCREDCDGYMQELTRVQPQANACREELTQEHPFAALQQLLTKDQEV